MSEFDQQLGSDKQNAAPSTMSKVAYAVGVIVWLALFGMAFYMKAS
ncbi:MAG: hypothetical protein V4692_00490 [Bdellovibrionota bacterium]